MALSRITNPFLSSSGSGNASITSPSANTIAFSTTTSERMRIDSSGNVGIGLTPTTYKFEVTGGDVRTNTSAFLWSNTLRLRGTDTYQIYESAATTNLQIGTNGAAAFIFTAVGVGERMRINAGAPILCLSGGSTTATGTGIAFPATQSASTDANTLDDYEEGTFTPTIAGTTTAGTASYTQQVGQYTKIGNRVFINIYLQWSGGTGSGNMIINGLPFTSESSALNQSLSNYNGSVAMTAGHVMQLITGTNSTQINVNSVPSGGGADANVPYDASALILVGGSYRAA